jgi:hypothetical protein
MDGLDAVSVGVAVAAAWVCGERVPMSLATGDPLPDVACVGARGCLVCRSSQSVVGTPVATARIAADWRGFTIEVGLTGDGADRGDLFAARTAAGARRPAGPETAGGLALRVWVTGSCGWSGCRC